MMHRYIDDRDHMLARLLVGARRVADLVSPLAWRNQLTQYEPINTAHSDASAEAGEQRLPEGHYVVVIL